MCTDGLFLHDSLVADVVVGGRTGEDDICTKRWIINFMLARFFVNWYSVYFVL